MVFRLIERVVPQVGEYKFNNRELIEGFEDIYKNQCEYELVHNESCDSIWSLYDKIAYTILVDQNFDLEEHICEEYIKAYFLFERNQPLKLVCDKARFLGISLFREMKLRCYTYYIPSRFFMIEFGKLETCTKQEVITFNENLCKEGQKSENLQTLLDLLLLNQWVFCYEEEEQKYGIDNENRITWKKLFWIKITDLAKEIHEEYIESKFNNLALIFVMYRCNMVPACEPLHTVLREHILDFTLRPNLESLMKFLMKHYQNNEKITELCETIIFAARKIKTKSMTKLRVQLKGKKTGKGTKKELRKKLRKMLKGNK